ncbi:ABC transporter ATP-binding protein [Candidatus Dependentiae bacterium]|nr:ABC transporter ATP-binding protein [Candidatus Dependentiae bacterium]
MGDNELQALKGVSLSIDAGEFVALTGFSGSGKSTLIHLLGCLDIPTTGHYAIDGIDVSSASRDELARVRNQKIGFVFQKFHLLPDLDACNNVALPMLYAGVSEDKARIHATKLLSDVGLENRTDHFPYQLSGGEQQRVAIARSLANNPSIILADEPTGNLDMATGDVIMNIFADLNKNKGCTIILVTHEPSIAAKTKRIIELIDGKIVKDFKAGNS